jgi:hypothetical protein
MSKLGMIERLLKYFGYVKHKEFEFETRHRFVQSQYNAKWYGVILREWPSGRCLVLIVRHKDGSAPKKRIITPIGIGWLKPIEPFDISGINENWFCFDPSIDIDTPNGWNYYEKRK